MAAELVHPDLEGYMGPGRGLLEDHRERLSGKQQVLCPGFFLALELVCFIEQLLQFQFIDIKDRNKIFLHRSSFICAIRRLSSSCVPISLRWRTFPFTADAADSAACSACSSVSPKPTKARVREVWVTSPPFDLSILA